MPEHNEPEKVWDEYDWERFLQEQDRKTEAYMELLEESIDDPDRDQIIAKAMGWTHLPDLEEPEWVDFPEIPPPSSDAPGGFYGETPGGESDGDDDHHHAGSLDEEASASFESHPLYRASLSLTDWIDRLFATVGERQNHPAATELATHCAMANAKLAAALSDDQLDEPGMTIAYLKRALKAITTALEAGDVFIVEARLSASRRQQLRRRLFQVRDGIISLMGEYRTQWRQRFRP